MATPRSVATTTHAAIIRRGRRLVRSLYDEGRREDAQVVQSLLEKVGGGHAPEDGGERHWLTTGEVARRVGVSRQTVVNWVKKGILPGERVGGRTLIAAAALVEFGPFERILDALDAERPPATPDEAAQAVARIREGWKWQEPNE